MTLDTDLSLTPWAEDMAGIFQEKQDLFTDEIVEEFEDLVASIHGHMIRISNLEDRMNEILKEHLGENYSTSKQRPHSK